MHEPTISKQAENKASTANMKNIRGDFSIKPEEVIYWNQLSKLIEPLKQRDLSNSKTITLLQEHKKYTSSIFQTVVLDGEFSETIETTYTSPHPLISRLLADMGIVSLKLTIKLEHFSDDKIELGIYETVNQEPPRRHAGIEITKSIYTANPKYAGKPGVIIKDVARGGHTKTNAALGKIALRFACYAFCNLGGNWKKLKEDYDFTFGDNEALRRNNGFLQKALEKERAKNIELQAKISNQGKTINQLETKVREAECKKRQQINEIEAQKNTAMKKVVKLERKIDSINKEHEFEVAKFKNKILFWETKYNEIIAETEARTKERIEKERYKQEQLKDLKNRVSFEEYERVCKELQECKDLLLLVDNATVQRDFFLDTTISELYVGEIKNILLDCIEHELKNAREHSRRYDILTSIIKVYGHSDIDEKSQKIKNLFKGYRSLDAKISQELAKFNIQSQDTKKHAKVSLAGDPRYTIAISSSGSDRLGGINTANDIIKMFF